MERWINEETVEYMHYTYLGQRPCPFRLWSGRLLRWPLNASNLKQIQQFKKTAVKPSNRVKTRDKEPVRLYFAS